MSGCCVMALRLQSGKEECEVSNRGEKESEEERNRREMRFLRLWGACQPSLFPEWEREMDLREAEEERHRQEEAARAQRGRRATRLKTKAESKTNPTSFRSVISQPAP